MKNKILFSVLMILVIISMFDIVNAGSGGGAAVPVNMIDLTEQGDNYVIKPSRLKFEFNEKLYAIQVRRVKQEYVWFLVMKLDMDKLNDITAYTLDDSFNLSIGERKEIDINKDGIKDISIELNNIISNVKSIRSADFSIKKIKIEPKMISSGSAEVNTELLSLNEITGSKIQEPISEPVIVLNQELSQKQPTLLEKIINFLKELFK